jgi:mannose/fructose/N-acetylgalactosamine-specific phosphotransferase system component IIC
MHNVSLKSTHLATKMNGPVCSAPHALPTIICSFTVGIVISDLLSGIVLGACPRIYLSDWNG